MTALIGFVMKNSIHAKYIRLNVIIFYLTVDNSVDKIKAIVKAFQIALNISFYLNLRSCYVSYIHSIGCQHSSGNQF